MIQKNAYLLRRGMALRQHQIEKLISPLFTPELYPDYLFKVSDGLVYGTEEYRRLGSRTVEYKPREFIESCPNLYARYMRGPGGRIRREDYTEEELLRGMKTGYIKHDQKGYYIDNDVYAYIGIIEER